MSDPTEALSKVEGKTGLTKDIPNTVKTVDTATDPTVALQGASSKFEKLRAKHMPTDIDIGGQAHSLQRLGYDSRESYDEYTKTFTANLAKPDPEAANLTRARNQSGWEQAGTAAYQLVPNVAMGILETAGYLLDFNNYMGMLGIVDTNYDNWLSSAMRDGRTGLTKWDPIYREHPDEVWAPTDSAWWIENTAGLVESVVEFGVTGFGVGTGLKAGAKLIGGAMAKGVAGTAAANIAGKATQVMQKSTQLLTAASLAYTEGVMVGVNVYDTIYKEGIAAGLSKEEATKNASDAASTTVRTNMLNTALNYTAVGTLFKSTKSLRSNVRQGWQRQVVGGKKESYSQWLTRLKGEPKVMKHPGILKKVGKLVKEGAFESAEELINEVSQREGELVGRRQSGTLLPEEKDTDLGDRIWSAFTSEEGRLAMTMGFVGGVGNTMFLGGIEKAHRAYKNHHRAKNGQEIIKSPEQLVSESYETELSQLIEKGEELEKITNSLMEGVEKGDAQQIKDAQNALASQSLFSAFQGGTPEVFISMLEEIESIDDSSMGPDGMTDAERAGLETNKDSDQYYKKIARQKLTDVKELQESYDKAMDKFWMGDQETMNYANKVFGYKVMIKTAKNALAGAEEDVAKFDKDLQDRLENAGYEGAPATLIETLSDYDASVVAHNEVLEEISEMEAMGTMVNGGMQYSQDPASKKRRAELKIKYGLPPNAPIGKSLSIIKQKLAREKAALEKKGGAILSLFETVVQQMPDTSPDPDADEKRSPGDLLSELDPKSFGNVEKLYEIFKKRAEGEQTSYTKELTDALEKFKEVINLTNLDYHQLVQAKAYVEHQKTMIEAFQLEYDAMNKPGALHEYLKKEREDKQNKDEKEAEDKANKEADKRKESNEEKVEEIDNKIENDENPPDDFKGDDGNTITRDEVDDYQEKEDITNGDGSPTKEDMDKGETTELNEEQEHKQLNTILGGQKETGDLKYDALSFAYLARGYKVVKDGDKQYTTATGALKEGALHNDLESHTRFQPNTDTQYTIEIAPDADNVPLTNAEIVNGQPVTMTFGEWKKGKTAAEIENAQPLVIKDGDQIVAFVHDARPAIEDGKEVVREGESVGMFVYRRIVEKDGETDNWALQTKRLRDFRKKSMKLINKKETPTIQITSKSYGAPILNKVDGKVTETEVSEVMGPNVQVAISHNGELMKGGSTLGEMMGAEGKEIINDGKLANGAVYVILPTPVHGKYFAAYVRAPQLGQIENLTTQQGTSINGDAYAVIVSQAIGIHLKIKANIPLSDQEIKIADGIETHTGIDIKKSGENLKKFAALYVVDRAFDAEDKNEAKGKRTKTGYGQFHIRTDEEGELKTIKYSIKGIDNDKQNISSHKAWVEKQDSLVTVLSASQFSVHGDSLVGEDVVEVPVLIDEGGGNYRVEIVEGAGNDETMGYEEFVKQNLKTKLKGERVDLSDGTKEWIYFDQPVITFSNIEEKTTSDEILEEMRKTDTSPDPEPNENPGPQNEVDIDIHLPIDFDVLGEIGLNDGSLDPGPVPDDFETQEKPTSKEDGDIIEQEMPQAAKDKTDQLLNKILPGVFAGMDGQKLIQASESIYTLILEKYDKLASKGLVPTADALFDYALGQLRQRRGIYNSVLQKGWSLPKLIQQLKDKGKSKASIANIEAAYSIIIRKENGAIDIDANRQRVNDFTTVIDEYDGLKKLVIEKLGRIGIKINDQKVLEYLFEGEEAADDLTDISVEDGVTESFGSKAKLKTDIGKTAPWQVRILLSRLAKINGIKKDGDTRTFIKDKNYLGMSTYVNYEDMYNNLLGILVGRPERFEDIVRTLNNFANETGNPQISALASFLTNIDQDPNIKNPNQLKSQLVLSFPANAEVMRVVAQITPNKNPDGSSKGSTILTFSGDTQNDTNLLIDRWKQNLQGNVGPDGIISEINGKLYISPKKAQELQDKYKELATAVLALSNAKENKKRFGRILTSEERMEQQTIGVKGIFNLIGIELSSQTALQLVKNPKKALGKLRTKTGQVTNLDALISPTGKFANYIFDALTVEPTIKKGVSVVYQSKEFPVEEVGKGKNEGKVKIDNKWISLKNVEKVATLESKNPFSDLSEGQIGRIRSLARLELKTVGVSIGTGSRNVNNQLLYKYSQLSKFTEQAKLLQLANSLDRSDMANMSPAVIEAAEELHRLSKIPFQFNSEWLSAFNKEVVGEKPPKDLTESEKRRWKKRKERYNKGELLRQVFKVEIVDGLTHGIRRGVAVEIADMTPKEFEIYKLGLFQNNGNENVAKYVYMTPADNTVIPVIHALRKKIELQWNDAVPTGEVGSIISIGKEGQKMAGEIFEAEMLRIIAFQKLSPSEQQDVKGYKDGADKFIMFPFLNRDLMTPEEQGLLWDSEGNLIMPLGDEQKLPILNLIERTMIASIQEQVADWSALGVFSRSINNKGEFVWDLGGFSEKYMDKMKTPGMIGTSLNVPGQTVDSINNRAIEAAAADYVLNNMFAAKEMFQVMSGDPAFYYKAKQGQNLQENLLTTFANLNKRISEVRATGSKGFWHNPLITSNEGHAHRAQSLNIIIAKDREVGLKNMEQMKALLKEYSESYGKIETTDGQSVTTLGEHLAILMAYGKITDQQFLDLSARYGKQLKAIKKLVVARKSKDKKAEKQALEELTDASFTKEEIKDVIMQPLKPVYTGFKTEESSRRARVVYLKTSSFPLIPQVVKDLEISKVMLQLENSGADMMIYESGVKVGASNIKTIYDKEGEILDDLEFTKEDIIVLPRSGYKIQQENPYKGTKGKVRESTQGQKMLFEGLIGKSKNGKIDFDQKRREFNEAQTKILDLKYNQFLKNIGAKKVKREVTADNETYEVDDIIIEDLSILKDFLVKEAMERGYPLNDIMALGLTRVNTFDLPLGFHLSAFRMEPLLLSLIKNKILKSELPGNTYIQGSGAGFKGIKGFNELSSEEQGDIVWTEGYNPEEGLSYMMTEKKEITRAQIILPWTLKGKNGKIIDVNKYVKKVGNKKVLDTSKMSKELLDIFGFRIPLQGHSSMVVLEVVGFLPEYQGDLAIVPDGITTQMGSDFDVDKLMTYTYWTYELDDGRLVKYGSREHAEDKHRKDQERAAKKAEEKDSEIGIPEDSTEGYARVAITSEKYTPKFIKDNPDLLFVFGDNMERKGKGGQAIVRDESNVIGLRTKVSPTRKDDAYFYDEFLEDNKKAIDEDIAAIKKAGFGTQTVFPKGGIGTGLASLKEKAPKTYAYLNKRLLEVFGFDNETGTIVSKEEKQDLPEGEKTVEEVENELQNNMKGLQNQVVGIYNDVMATPEAIKKGLTPLDDAKEKINETGELLEKLMTAPGTSPLFIAPTTQRDFFFINKDGQTALGVYSLFSTFLAQAQHHNLEFKYEVQDPDNPKATMLVPLKIKFKGAKGNIIAGNKVSDSALVTRKGTKNSVTSGFQSAGMDNANDQALHKFNLSGPTFGISLAMISQGFDEEYIGAFTNQEAIKLWLETYNRKISKVTEDTVKGRKKASEEAFNEVEQILTDKAQRDDTENSPRFLTDQEKLNLALSLTDMHDMLEATTDQKGKNYWGTQLNILAQLEVINQMGEDISAAQNVTNTNQSMRHPGKSILDAIALKEKFTKALVTDGLTYLLGTEELIGNVIRDPNGDVFVVDPEGLIGSSAMYGELLATKLYNNLFEYESRVYEHAIEGITELTGTQFMPTERKQEIWTDLKAFVNAKVFEQVFGEPLDVARRRILFDEILTKKEVKPEQEEKEVIDIEEPSLARKLQLLQQTEWGKESKLLKRLYPKLAEDIIKEPSRIEYMASGNEKIDEPDLLREFYSWLNSDETITITQGEVTRTIALKDVANDLIKYAFLSGGVQNPRNFVRLIPFISLKDLGYTDAIRNISFADPYTLGAPLNSPFGYPNPSTFVRQYLQNKPYRAKTITKFDKKNQIKVGETITLLGGRADQAGGLTPKENDDFLTTIKTDEGGRPFYVHFLAWRNKDTKKWELYEKMSDDTLGKNGIDRYTVYERISSLGTLQDMEFDPTVPFALSQNQTNLPEKIVTSPAGIPRATNNTSNQGLKYEGDGQHETIFNIQEPTNFLYDKMDKDSTGKERITRALKNIMGGSKSTFAKTTAKIFLDFLDTWPADIELGYHADIANDNIPFTSGKFSWKSDDEKGFSRGVITLYEAADRAWVQKLSPDQQQAYQEMVFMHEMTHAFTSAVLNKVQKGTATPEMKQFHKNLLTLRGHTLNALIKSPASTPVVATYLTPDAEGATLGELFGENWKDEASRKAYIEDVAKRYRTKSSPLTKAELAFIYPLIDATKKDDIAEFLTGIMTSPTLQSFMMSHTVPKGYKEGKNLWDQILNAFYSLFRDFKKDTADLKGVKDSLLEHGMNQTLNIMGAQNTFFKNMETVTDGEFVTKESIEEVDDLQRENIGPGKRIDVEGDPDVEIYKRKVYTEKESKEIFRKIERLYNDTYNKEHQPSDKYGRNRRSMYYGDVDYAYGQGRAAVLRPKAPLPPEIQKVIRETEAQLGYPEGYFDMILINEYQDGNQKIAFHTDNEANLNNEGRINPTVVTLSFGETRTMKLEKMGSKQITDIVVEDGTALTMGKDSQLRYKHGLQPEMAKGKRFSITLRHDAVSAYQKDNEMDIALLLPPIEQNFKDESKYKVGNEWKTRKMQPKFKGKSAMDLIISGDRTRTTRAKKDIERMAREYGLTRISDLEGKVIRMTDKEGREVYTRITGVFQFTQEYQDQTWEQEGWEKSVTDRLVGEYPYAIEFQVIPGTATGVTEPIKPTTPTPKTPTPITADLPSQILRGSLRANVSEAGKDTVNIDHVSKEVYDALITNAKGLNYKHPLIIRRFLVAARKYMRMNDISSYSVISMDDLLEFDATKNFQNSLLGINVDIAPQEEISNIETINGVKIKTGDLKLTGDQIVALQKMADFFDKPDGNAFSLRGYAGTGKTTLTKFFLQYIRAKKGKRATIGLATPTHKANAVLYASIVVANEEAGIGKIPPPKTIDSKLSTAKMLDKYGRVIFSNQFKNPEEIEKAFPRGSTMIFDEASMIKDSFYKAIIEIVKNNNIKAIFMGDPLQLPPVGEKPQLSDALNAPDHYELTEVKRQESTNALVPILQSLRDNRLSKTDQFEHQTALDDHGRGIEWTAGLKDFENFISSYMGSGSMKDNVMYAKVIAYTNAAVKKYNNLSRRALLGEKVMEGGFQVGEPIMGYAKSGQVQNMGEYQIVEQSSLNEQSFDEAGIEEIAALSEFGDVGQEWLKDATGRSHTRIKIFR